MAYREEDIVEFKMKEVDTHNKFLRVLLSCTLKSDPQKYQMIKKEAYKEWKRDVATCDNHCYSVWKELDLCICKFFNQKMSGFLLLKYRYVISNRCSLPMPPPHAVKGICIVYSVC